MAPLRVKDIDLDRQQITVRRGEGAHDRAAFLSARQRHGAELDTGRGEVDLPDAPRTKMPSAATAFAWQYVFPASRPCNDPATGRLVLHHLHASALQTAIRAAAGIDPRATSRTLRHCFAARPLEGGTDIRIIQTLIGHKDVRTTMIYADIVDRGPPGVVSPLDR